MQEHFWFPKRVLKVFSTKLKLILKLSFFFFSFPVQTYWQVMMVLVKPRLWLKYREQSMAKKEEDWNTYI